LVRDVTIPMLSPVILFHLIIGIIGALQLFAQPFVIFHGGGPLNSVLVYSVQLYTIAFQQFRMGYAAAMAWILFLVVLALTGVAVRLSRTRVKYMGG
jgi:multiple sugar transport system permease protein